MVMVYEAVMNALNWIVRRLTVRTISGHSTIYIYETTNAVFSYNERFVGARLLYMELLC